MEVLFLANNVDSYLKKVRPHLELSNGYTNPKMVEIIRMKISAIERLSSKVIELPYKTIKIVMRVIGVNI